MKACSLIVCLILTFFSFAQVHVNGYYHSNGTYVAPYIRSSPNSTPTDNYSYPGNTNPYTGKTATGNPDTYIKNQSKSNISTSSTSDVWVDGYYKSDGTYVQGYYRSAPDGNPYNNYSFPGNTNPHTGKTATGNPDTYSNNYNGDPTYSSGLTYYVSSNILNVRSGPSTSSLILTSLNKGDDVEVLETINSAWKKVSFYGITGYVYSSYISFIKPTSTYFNSSVSTIDSWTQTSEPTVKNNSIKEVVDTSKASKDDTKRWILSKLQTYTSDKYYYNPSASVGGSSFFNSGTYLENFFFYIDEYNLIVEYQEELSSSKTEKRELSIPIYDISKIYDYQGKIVFMTNNKTMIDHNITTNKQSTKNYFSVQFDVNAETDLCERISRAFLHLKKFYKKPVTNEPF